MHCCHHRPLGHKWHAAMHPCWEACNHYCSYACMQVSLGVQKVIVTAVEASADSYPGAPVLPPDLVLGALEGFAVKGLFGVLSAARMQPGNGKQEVIEMETLLRDGAGSNSRGGDAATGPSKILQPVLEEQPDSFGDTAAYDDSWTPPPHQFRHLFPYHILTDSQGHIVQVSVKQKEAAC